MPNHSAPLALGSPRFPGAELSTVSKTQGALAAWSQLTHGNVAQKLAEVQGDFALGLPLANGDVLLAVDRFAVQPLCYCVTADGLRFAPRADELGAFSQGIDPQAIFDYLYFHCIPSPRTIFKGVYRLPAGHYALWQGGKLTVAPYWTPSFQENNNASFSDLRDQFRGILLDAVREQLDGSKPACFLSGGTDSSTVAGMIGLAGERPAASYSIGFEAQGYDEMAFARIAAKEFKTEHHEYYVTPSDLVDSIGAVASHFDQPFGNSSAAPAYYCAKMAKEDGVTKLLAGDGGDELFGGNSRYAKQRIFGWYQCLPGALRTHLLEPALSTRLAGQVPLVRKASSYVEQASVPMPDRLQMYNLIMRLGVDNILTPNFLQSVDQGAPLRLQQSVWHATPASSAVNEELAFDWRFTLAESDLPKVVGATSLAGVKVGFPMLDDRLLQFSLNLPTSYKLKGLKLRWFFKEALRGFLPDDILTKKKQGFGLPFGVWANSDKALNGLASESVHGLVERGVIHREFVQTLFTQRLKEYPGYYGEMVWILMMLEQWLRKHAPGYKVA